MAAPPAVAVGLLADPHQERGDAAVLLPPGAAPARAGQGAGWSTWCASSCPPATTTQRHFTPTYKPWDQRVCLVPDGDLFQSIRDGRASVVTDTIERFTERASAWRRGQELAADIVVTATGSN